MNKIFIITLLSLVFYSCDGIQSKKEKELQQECNHDKLVFFAICNKSCSDPTFRTDNGYVDYDSCMDGEFGLNIFNCEPL